MGTVPVETPVDPLRPPGAVLVQRDGVPVVGHYGSVAAEIAVCTKAAGLVDRSSLRQLALTGPEPLLDHVLAAAVPDGVPKAGQALLIAGSWCCRTTARRAIVAGGPSAVTRWRQVASRAISTAGLDVQADLLPDSAVLTLSGPRAALVVEHGHPPAVWHALWEAGREYGLAPVGNEALELLRAAHRPLG
jgi:glycine cleavage system aminomethyltransferase T